MDASMIVSDHLNSSALGVTSYTEVPRNRPDEFCVVEQTSGSVQERALVTFGVDVDCWARTRARAADLASRVTKALLDMPDELPNVFHAEITTTYNNPDYDSGAPRYTVGASVTYSE